MARQRYASDAATTMTRMGLHINSGLGWDKAVDYCRRVQPAFMKWLSPSVDVLRQCKAVSPNTRHVLRPYWAQQEMGAPWDAFVRHTMDAVREFGTLINWYEGYNEYDCSTPEKLRVFCNAEIDRAKKLNAAGVGAACGGFSTGAFDTGGRAYDAALPLLRFLHATSPNNVWHSHEYAGPYMGYMVRTPDGRNQWIRTPENPGGSYNGWSTDGNSYWLAGLDGWLTLRYRMLRKRLEADGLTNVRMILTETGIDDTNPRPGGANKRGWRDYDGTEWSRIPGQGNYAEQQRWYGWHLTHDPYVLGWSDFGFGSEDPAWWSFDLSRTDAMREQVIASQLRLPVGTEEEHMTKLVDVSEYQGTINWARMKAAGVEGVYIRFGGGIGRPGEKGELDRRAHENVAGAMSVGMPWGPYWWYANGLNGQAQSAAFANLLHGYTPDFPPAMDWELEDAALTEAHVLLAVDTCEAKLGKPLFYTSTGWATKHRLDAWEWLRDYPLWLARYTTVTPPAPAPWAEWIIWQHSAGGNKQGAAHGVQSEDIDLNVSRLGITQLKALASYHASINTELLVAAAEAEHRKCGIRYNPEAALWREIAEAGYYPTTSEFDYDDESGHYVAQRAENALGAVVFYWDARTGTVSMVPVR